MDFSQIIQAALLSLVSIIVPAVAAIVAKIVLLKIREFEALLIRELRIQDTGEFRALVTTVISAAEKNPDIKRFVAGVRTEAEAKRAWAIDTLQAILKDRGLNFSLAEIVAEIEHQVRLGVHKAQIEDEAENAPKSKSIGFAVGSSLDLSDEERDEIEDRFTLGFVDPHKVGYKVGLVRARS